MPVWAIASIPYFSYVAAVALIRPRTHAAGRHRALAWSALGCAIAVAGAFASWFWLRLIVLPPLALLASYWASGSLWVGPMPQVERFLVESDDVLRVRRIAAAIPRVLVEFQEFSYAAVYPLIPLALAAHYLVSPAPDADRFWTVILVTDFICFGMLPWIQTRPPRALESRPPWRSSFRAFNVRLLGQTSIGVNTVPSGHAAEALAAALILSSAPWPVASIMWVFAASISAGAVFGRYHFALDAVAGWVVALGVWAVLW
jgi:membrane-associated phospholipid phosphatase